MEFGGVIYTESAEKAARFILDCNQNRIPLIFLHDVNGFMVGQRRGVERHHSRRRENGECRRKQRRPENHRDLRRQFRAGNYAMCGKAYDPRFMLRGPRRGSR